jgi:hypothetical protein
MPFVNIPHLDQHADTLGFHVNRASSQLKYFYQPNTGMENGSPVTRREIPVMVKGEFKVFAVKIIGFLKIKRAEKETELTIR